MACRGGEERNDGAQQMSERQEDCTAKYVASSSYRRQVIASFTVVSPRDLWMSWKGIKKSTVQSRPSCSFFRWYGSGYG